MVSAKVVRLRKRQRASDPPLSDEAIARACAGGDPTAVGLLFDRFQAPVTRYIGRLVADGADVQDLVQSTFLEVARGKTTYDGRAKVSTWLLAIATNVVRHHRRASARRYRLLSAIAQRDGGRPSGVDARTDARIQLARARRALESLSDESREAFVLCDLEGLSAKEAAAVLGVSEAAVWKRASRARKDLRRLVRGTT